MEKKEEEFNQHIEKFSKEVEDIKIKKQKLEKQEKEIEKRENEVNRRGKDIDPDDPDLIRDILEGARTWLEEVLPQVFERVKTFFDNIISTLTTWVQNGLKYVVELIGKILGKDLN